MEEMGGGVPGGAVGYMLVPVNWIVNRSHTRLKCKGAIKEKMSADASTPDGVIVRRGANKAIRRAPTASPSAAQPRENEVIVPRPISLPPAELVKRRYSCWNPPPLSVMEQFSNRRENVYDAEKLSQHKLEVQSQLLKDEQKVRALKESLSTAHSRTLAMVDIFNSFDNRLVHLESEIVPFHQNTTHLTIMHENIDKTCTVFQHMISQFAVYDDVNGLISDAGGVQDIPTYLSNMRKAEGARKYLEECKLTCGQHILDALIALLATGETILQNEFKKILQQNSSVCCFAGLTEGVDIPLQPQFDMLHFSPEIIERLSLIGDYLTNSIKNNRYSRHYVVLRSDYLVRSLRTLSVEGGLESLVTTNNAKASVRYKPTTGGTCGAVDMDGNAIIVMNTATSKVYEKGTHPYLVVLTVFARLLMDERDRVERIIPASINNAVYEETIAKCVEVFVRTGDFIVRNTQKVIERREFLHTFHLFDILQRLNSSDFDPILQVAGKNCGIRLLDLNTNFMITCSQILQDISMDIKKNTSKVSLDGTVHEITSNTLNLFGRLYEYCGTCEQVLRATDAKNDDDRPMNKIGEYFAHVAMALQQVLANKALAYGDKMLQSIFLLNNNYYILKVMKNSPYYPLMGPAFEKAFQNVFQTQLDVYKLTWNKALNYIMETPMDPSIRFPKNAKDEVKERFRGFNNEFEDMILRQSKCSVPDEDLRNQLKQINIDMLVPVYKDFRS
eukprot:Ihof_evm4s122 gene=Ihof_evmTU4s122